MASCRALFSRIPSILPRSSLSSSSAAIHRISNRCLSSASIDHNDGAIRPRPATDNDDHQTASSYDHHSSSSHSSSSSHHNNTPKSSPVASSSHSSSPSSKHSDLNGLSDTEAVCRLTDGRLKFFSLENHFDYERAVRIRRLYLESLTNKNLSDLPFKNYEYQKIHGQCAENVMGYLPLPIGVAGPVIIDGKQYFIPLATTEGALIASTTRGCKALSAGGGVQTQILRDGMSRAPVLAAPSAAEAAKLKLFLDNNFDKVAEVFNSTSRFARLRSLHCAIAGRYLFVRFECQTGDAMGMNMVGKGTEKVVQWIGEEFPAFKCLSLSGNFCIDKKPSAINWIMGRGKSVVAECVIPAHIVSSVLKTNVDALVELNIAKNLIGSAMAGSVGGYNAHAANLVAAVFLATGQDPAQVVESSNCMTLMEPRLREEGEGLNKKIVKDLYISVTMPSIEVGTVGGGTSLSAQSSMLKLLGVQGATTGDKQSGDNARQLARVVASAVLAGELSLMSALSSGDLIKSHLKLNRKPAAATHAPNGHH